jgi:hypothetical protein
LVAPEPFTAIVPPKGIGIVLEGADAEIAGALSAILVKVFE